MSDYRKYLLRQMGLKEAQFVPFVREDEHPDIDPQVLMRKKKKEMGEHPHLSAHDAELVAKQHMKKGVDEQSPMISPTAIATPIIAVGIRGSSSGGLPSGADQRGQDLAPNKLGGYDRVEPEMLNSKLIDKTPKNPEIGQEAQPIVNNPSTGQGVTHPHQIQVTAGEEPQSTTGASTDSDPTLKLKSAAPKGIDIEVPDAAPSHEEENPMIPATSLSEVFEKHKKLMYEKIGACSCGHMKKECDCKPDCKCGCNKKVEECSTCGCDDPEDKHGLAEADKKKRVCYHCKQPHPCPCDKKDEDDAKLARDNPEKYRKQFGMRVDKRSDLSEAKCTGKADCMCKQCKEPDYEDYKKKKGEFKGIPKSDLDKDDKIPFKKGKVNESYSSAFERMRGLAGVGTHQVLGRDGLWESKEEKEDLSGKCCECGKDLDNDSDTCYKCKAKLRPDRLSQFTEGHAAGENFNTHWKMDKEKAGFVKIDEEKLNQVKAQLEKKSKRGSLSDKELQLMKTMNEVMKKRSNLDKQSQAVDNNIGKMQNDPTYRPAPFDKDRNGPMRQGNDKGQLPAK